jgi:predicted RNase H-like HicB family nuclease
VAITYDLFLESGPRRQKTMVHVLALLGCIATGPTTEAALDATPEAIAAYRRLLERHGEAIDPAEPFRTRVIEHLTEGSMLGEGSPYAHFAPDLVPLTEPEIGLYLNRLHGLTDEMATWAAAQTDEQLDAAPAARRRTARAMLLHVISARGAFLSSALSGAPGFGKIEGAAERGELPLPVALRQAADLVDDYLRSATPDQRQHVRDLNGNYYTLRKAVRRILEHDWEHLRELARRPAGPRL